MSIIQTTEVSALQSKTLIFFSLFPASHKLKDSLTYTSHSTFPEMVNDFRHFQIENFPIICYDEGDMNMASTAYCILKAMNLDALVLYGGLRAWEVEGLALVEYSASPIAGKAEPSEVDVNLLVNVHFRPVTIKNFPFSIYEVIGKNITVDKVKKLLELHGICVQNNGKVLAGASASLLALLTVYFGFEFPSVYLGDWEMKGSLKKSLENEEVFHSIAESVYYDALEDTQSERKESLAKQDAKVQEHYKPPRIPVNKTASDYQYENPGTEHCKSCYLL